MPNEPIFALSEETKNRILKKLDEKIADPYSVQPGVMREYYSRMWIVALQRDIPPMGGRNWCRNRGRNDESHKVYFAPAWILERVDVEGKDYSIIQKRVWNGRNVVIDKVYNPVNRWARAYDDQGRFIVYYAIKDMFGTVWIWRPSTWSRPGSCSYSSSDSSSSSNSFSESSSSGFSWGSDSSSISQ